MVIPTRYELDPAVVDDQLRAFKVWDRDSNLPDVVKRADLLARPDLVARVLTARASDRRGPEPLLVLPYPKDDGTHRTTCQLDPYDDVRFALLVSSIAERTEVALPDARIVQSTRFLRCGRAYRAEGWREANQRRGAVVDPGSGDGVGGFDVNDYFGSLSHRERRTDTPFVSCARWPM